MNARLLAAFLPLAVLVALASCGKKKPPEVPEPPVAQVVADAGPDVVEDVAPPPLFERIGGADGIKQVIEKFVENLNQDPALNKTFKATKGPRLDAFKKNLADQICELTGGPCKYAGKDMKSTHKGMKITEAQFDAFLTDLKLAMGEMKVSDADQNEVVEKLQPMKEDVVEVKPKPAAPKK